MAVRMAVGAYGMRRSAHGCRVACCRRLFLWTLLQIANLNVALFRLIRILRLVRYLRNLRKLCTTLLHTLPALLNVGAVLLLLLYMYAVFGTSVFGKVLPQESCAFVLARIRGRRIQLCARSESIRRGSAPR